MQNAWVVLSVLSMLGLAVTVFAGEKQSVVLKDPPALQWGKDGATTFCGALAKGLALDGQTHTYAELMVDTGLAFRVRWYQGNDEKKLVCPSSPVGEFEEEIKLADQAIGRTIQGVVRLNRPEPHMEEFLPRILEELTAGRPVMGYDQAMNVNLIVGYDAAKNMLLTRDYFRGDKTVEIAPEKLRGHLMFIGKKGEAPATATSAARGIEHAINNWTRDEATKHEGQAFYAYGKQAYDRWIKDLKDADTNENLAKQLFQPSWWTFDSLNDARRAGGKHLRVLAETSKAKDELLQAAAICDEFEKLTVGAYLKRDVFIGPWSGKKQDSWDAAMRQREIAMLEKARELDEKLIAQLKLALAKMK